jgi:hypothetical protein
MAQNRHTIRSLISFLVAWSFLALIVSGIVLLVVPKGRTARMMDWSMLGLDKWQWSDVHIVVGTLFIVTGIWHLYLNWSPFKRYWAERTTKRWRIKRELLISIAMISSLTGLAAADLPPASWVSGLQDSLKQQQGWVIQGGRRPQARQSQRSGKNGGHYLKGKGRRRLAAAKVP